MREATLSDLHDIAGWIARDAGRSNEAGVQAVLHDPMSMVLLEGNGGAMFVWRGPGIFEVHVLFEQRGREVLDLSHRMLAHMRENYGARLFWASVPYDGGKQSRKVRLFTRMMGWKSQGFANLAHGFCELFIGE
jgi:hypothetical protein